MRSWAGWGVRRARASTLLLGALFALVAVTSGILAFALGNSGVLATAAARDALTSAPAEESGVRAQTRVGPDADAQDALARAKLTEGFAPAPVTIWTTLLSEPRTATGADGALDQRVILWSGQHLQESAALTAGVWPSAPTQAALHADAAEATGIREGATLTIDDHELTVTGLWLPKDAEEPLWFAEPLALTGTDGTQIGPLVVDRSVLTGGEPFIRWGVVPDVATIAPDELGALAEGAERARSLVKEADVTGRGIVADGDLAATAAAAERGWAIGDAFGFVPVSLLLLVAVVGLVQVAGLLAATREREVGLLFARGASGLQLLLAGFAEAAVVTALGAALGTAVAAGLVWLLAGNASQIPTVAWGGLASLVLAFMCLATVNAVSIWRLSRGEHPRADRVRALAGAAALVLILAAAALTTWQLRRAGTFLVTDDEGRITTDLISALAPAVLLAAAAVVGLVALAPVTRLLEALAHAGRSARLWLAGAQLARGLVVQAVPVVLTILATGTATLASLYAGSSAALQRDVEALSQGAPVRVAVAGAEAGQPLALPDLSQVDGVGDPLPVWRDEFAQVGDLKVAALGAPVEELAQIATLPGGAPLDVAPLAVPSSGIPLSASTVTVKVTGRLYLDPWEQGQFETLPSFHRALASGVPEASREEQYLLSLASEAEAYERDAGVEVSLLVRNSAGLSTMLPGPTLSLTPTSSWGDDGALPTFNAVEGSVEGTIELPPGDYVLTGVRLANPISNSSAVRSLNLSVDVLANGSSVLGESTAQWVSDHVIAAQHFGPYQDQWDTQGPPTPTTQELDMDGTIVEFQVVAIPSIPRQQLDTRTAPWRLRLNAGFERTLTVGPGIVFDADPYLDPEKTMADYVAPHTPPVPVAITPALARASSLEVGTVFEPVLFGRKVRSVVAQVVDTIPGVAAANGILVDSAAYSEALAATFTETIRPAELWATLDGDPAAAADAIADLPGVAGVDVAQPEEGEADTAAQAFWMAAASALVLAITGLAAATATQLAARRPEVAVLRALGMTPSAQAGSRAWETGGILFLATNAGIVGGAVVAWLVVGPVSQSAAGGESIPTTLTPELGPWLLLLGIGAVAVVVIVALLAMAVRRQALDAEYREEVR